LKRVGNLWLKVVSFPNLLDAAHKAAKGKKQSAGVARFMANLEPEILKLQRELETGAWMPGTPFCFEIHDPKTRTISAAPFRDRVVHHALIAPLEPIFERRMIHTSYACRKGKGQLAALKKAQQLLRQHDRFVKLDIRRCFPSMRHDVVLETLANTVKDQRVLSLCERLVRFGGDDVGLPIGNLTSQWFANLVMDRLDHFVKDQLGVTGYLRYMDDFVLFADDKNELAEHLKQVAQFLHDVLGLRVKEQATIHGPARIGLPFLGWHIHRGLMRLRPENLRRSKWRLRLRHWEHRQGWISEEELADCTRSVIAHLRCGSTIELRRKWPWPSLE
jgi:RNA-directed DNA polymerase